MPPIDFSSFENPSDLILEEKSDISMMTSIGATKASTTEHFTIPRKKRKKVVIKAEKKPIGYPSSKARGK